ncbi:MAG: response regulator transcription factor [Schwartzia sp.]|nr:response regulator transcription factor [Schwartzia sp. (in: firmicutes)]
MRIAIVEDDERDMEQLRGVIDAYTASRNMLVEIDAFSSGPDFLRDFEAKKYDLVFFDNYIGNGLGIDLARKARAADDEVEFVFVSMSSEFAVSGFDVRALHYLLKPAGSDSIAQVFERFRKHTQKPEAPMIEVTSDYHPVLIPVPSVRFIEVIDKTCFIRAKEDVPVRLSLEKLMELLPPDIFVRTHKSYAVRLGAIRSMEQNEFLLQSGDSVPIGRSYQSSCKSAFIEYLANRPADGQALPDPSSP